MQTNYKYDEDKFLKELKTYVDKTYNQHYSKNKFQATEFIIDGGHGEGFCIGNIMKYAQRYGNKNGYNKEDLMKVIHYALIMLHVHEKTRSKNQGNTLLVIHSSSFLPQKVHFAPTGTNTLSFLSSQWCDQKVLLLDD